MTKSAIVLIIGAASCAPMPDTPSLALRPAEQAVQKLPAPLPPDVGGPPANRGLAAQVAAIVEQARAGQLAFEMADRDGAGAIIAGRGKSIGSEPWIARETARSALEIAHAQSVEASAALDQLKANRIATRAPEAETDVAIVTAAQSSVMAIVERQTVRIGALIR